ncbi:hypothetical protein PLIIFM63780_002046 [Purpureocillium lilacinum]|nr:hypothetical protein PLIIFM63780_002046 [Purpureocillium lilacinum]
MLLPRAAALRGAALLVAIVIQIAPIQAAKQCYWMDGTITDSVVQPCNPDAEVSPCCALNKAKPDLCLSSGLCYSQDSGVEGFLYSDGWSAKWKAYNVLQCEAGNAGSQFCCRTSSDNTNCCGNKTAILSTSIGSIVFPTKTASAGGSSTSSTASATASTTCSPAKIDSATNNECPKDNTAMVGGAVGGVLGAALLVALGAIAVLCMRRPKDHSQEVVQPDQSAQYTPNLYKESPPGYPQTASSRGMEPSPMGIESVHVHAQELPVRQVHEVQGDLARERDS